MLRRGGEGVITRDNPASYTPKHLVEKIRHAMASLQVEADS